MASLSKDAVSIRPATLADTHYIAELKIESHHKIEHFDVVNSLLNELFVNEYKKRWLQKLQDGMQTLILSVEDKMSGFICYTCHDKAHSELANSSEINDIYLKPEIRGQQLGRLLCNAALKNIRKMHHTRVILWLAENRRQTRRFYEALGFKKTSIFRLDNIDENIILRENMYEVILYAK